MRRNIILLRLISALRWFLLVLPVLILFYQSNDLSLFQALTIQAFFSLCVLLLEVPTGYVGDRFGWRFSLIIGSFSVVVAMLVLTLSSRYSLFIVSELFMAIGYCMFSGSDSALLYETMIDLNQEQEYLGEEGMLLAFGYVSEGVAAILGGFLAYTSLRLPILVNFIAFLGLIPLCLMLAKPTQHRACAQSDINVEARRSLRTDAYSIAQFIVDDPIVKWVAIYSGFTGFLALISAWLMQSYFKLTGLEIYYIGILWALMNFSRSLAAGWVNVINYKIGTKALFLLIPLVIAMSAFFMGAYVSLFTMLLGLLIQAARGLQLPLVYMIINNRSRSDLRAAILSVEGMMMRLFFVFLGPLIGCLSDFESIHVAFYCIGGLSLFGGGFFYYKFQHYFNAHHLAASSNPS